VESLSFAKQEIGVGHSTALRDGPCLFTRTDELRAPEITKSQ